MPQVKSKDGTAIAFSREGSGPAVILVGGALVDKSENAMLATELARDFTVYNYDRRGRGESGDTQPYALQREVEDIEALISEAGGSACLFGASSGGALVLEAAASVAADKVAVYEVPYSLGDEALEAWEEYRKNLKAALEKDDRNQALVTFMKLAGSSDKDIEGAKNSSYWTPMLAIAPTLAYDAEVLGDGRPPVERLKKITQPTLVVTGGILDPGMQGLQPNFFSLAADEVAEALPHAERHTIENQGHRADPKELGNLLKEFFAK